MKTTLVLNETRINFADAHELLTSPSPRQLRHWARKGVRIEGGRTVTLEYASVGRRVVTSVEAFERFLLRQNGEEPIVTPVKKLRVRDTPLGPKGPRKRNVKVKRRGA